MKNTYAKKVLALLSEVLTILDPFRMTEGCPMPSPADMRKINHLLGEASLEAAFDGDQYSCGRLSLLSEIGEDDFRALDGYELDPAASHARYRLLQVIVEAEIRDIRTAHSLDNDRS
jgi:hypothetical protein